jgi:hypothetical protein
MSLSFFSERKRKTPEKNEYTKAIDSLYRATINVGNYANYLENMETDKSMVEEVDTVKNKLKELTKRILKVENSIKTQGGTKKNNKKQRKTQKSKK